MCVEWVGQGISNLGKADSKGIASSFGGERNAIIIIPQRVELNGQKQGKEGKETKARRPYV